MKTIERILIIFAAFALMMGIMYVVVNPWTADSSTSALQFERRLPPDGQRPALAEGQQPEFPEGERPEFRGERGGGWIFGAIKNIGIIAIIVTLIVLPKGWLQKRKRTAQPAS